MRGFGVVLAKGVPFTFFSHHVQNHRLVFKPCLDFGKFFNHFFKVVSVVNSVVGETEPFKNFCVLFLFLFMRNVFAEYFKIFVHTAHGRGNRHTVIV